VAYGASVPGSPPDAFASHEPAGLPSVPGHDGRVLPAAGGARGSVGDPAEPDVVEVRRSARRRRTVTAYRELGRTVVLIPAAFSPAEERRWVAQMVAKLQTREERRRRSLGGDDELMSRARALSAEHFDGLAEPASVRWVDNQHRRWGSCTPADRSIRLSSRLRSMPEYVVDYVLVHELVHLIEPGHDERFWALVARYPRAERARGFLEGVELASTAGAAAGEPSAADLLDQLDD
jgi:predicted metal-dependent hydrolase